MPFAYYGAKHGLARKYPVPRFGTIIEPFAGAAGYSCHHAAPDRHVILNDLDPAVAGLWRRLQSMTVADLAALDPVKGERTVDPLIAGPGGSTSMAGTLAGQSRQITPRMVDYWPQVRSRITRVLPNLRAWEIRSGSYVDLPDIEATWFIDPPYQPLRTYTTGDGAAGGYRFGEIDYDHLADWCLSRRGQVIVCEQSPAAWLPFTPLAMQRNGTQVNGADRQEVFWCSDFQQLDLFT